MPDDFEASPAGSPCSTARRARGRALSLLPPHPKPCSPPPALPKDFPPSPAAHPLPQGCATSLAPTPPCWHPVPHTGTALWLPPHAIMVVHPTSSPRAMLRSRTRGELSLRQDQLQIPPTLGGSDPLKYRLRVRGACATQPGKAGGASTSSHTTPRKSCFSRFGSSTVDWEPQPAGAGPSRENPTGKQQNPIQQNPILNQHKFWGGSPRLDALWQGRLCPSLRPVLGVWILAFGFFQRGNIFKNKKPQKLRMLLSSCEFPISCCTRTWHRKILSKFLLKNNKKTRKTHRRLSLPDTARQEGLTELLRSIGPIIHKLRQIYCTWQILTAPKKPSLSPGA